MEYIVSPSLLSCDLANMQCEVSRVYDAGASWLHIDVMDGHFVPNLTFGPPVIKCLRKKCKAFFDVHLMVTYPMDYIAPFHDAGADSITFHIESEGEANEIINSIKELGMKAGISIKPGTDPSEVFPYLDFVDMVLVMSVEPGFSGQKFMDSALPKMEKIRDEIKKRGLKTIIQADGGINVTTVGKVANSGATCFVSGSYVFGCGPEQSISGLINRARDSVWK